MSAALANSGATLYAGKRVDFMVPGAYEYLSSARGMSGDTSAGMKGVLNVTLAERPP